MKLKDYKKSKTGSVKVDPETLNEAKKFCKAKGILVAYFVTEAIKEKIQREKSK
jgi:predicted DNA-binding protein